jgi:hypothetical protein
MYFAILFVAVVVVGIPDKFENCSFYLSEELSWNFDGDCINSVDCFWLDGHFSSFLPSLLVLIFLYNLDFIALLIHHLTVPYLTLPPPPHLPPRE